MSEFTSTNPTRDQIEAAISAAEATNQGYRQRTEYFPAGLADRILSTPQGIVQRDGGGVANCYSYTTRSTVLGAAWYTDGTGTKHVRIAGAQQSCCGRHVTAIFGALATPFTATIGGRLIVLRRQRTRRAIERLAPAGDDDRLQIHSPLLIAASPEGLLVADDLDNPSVVQIVVRDATTGLRHHITVPPKFAHPDRKTYQRLRAQGEAALIHAALAWTFGLTPEQYTPTVQA